MRRNFNKELCKLLAVSLLGVSVGCPSVSADSREIGAGYQQVGFVTEKGTAIEFSNIALKVRGFLKANGDFMLSGDNSAGQLGIGDRSNQTGEVKALTEVHDFSIGSKYVIAVRKDGSLWGWGTGENGELLRAGAVVLSPEKICDGNFQTVSCGNSRVLALTRDGDLFEWGDGSTAMSFLGRGFVQISAGAEHYAAIKEDGSLWTWGSNANGELCDNNKVAKNVPMRVASGFEKVSCGDGFTIALDSQKGVWGAGKNEHGQLGSIGDATFKKLTNGLFWDVAADSTCSVLQSVTGKVITWGTSEGATNGTGISHEEYTLRFLGEEGATGEMEPVTAKFGRTLILPKCSFQKEGYSFKGWATEEGGKPVYADGASVIDLLTSQVFQDEILYAVWEPNKIVLATDYSGDISFSYGKAPAAIRVPNKTVTVTLNSNGGSSVSSVEVPLVFQGYVDKEGKEIFNKDGKYVGECTQSTELTAVWKAQETELPIPTKAGFVFGGWATSNTAQSGSKTFHGIEDTTLIATWVENGKVVYNFSQNGGIQASSSVVSVESGGEVSLDVTATKVGWELVGWNTDPNATTALESITMGESGLVLYAIFSKTVTVSFQQGEETAEYEVVYYNSETEREIELQKLTDHTKGTPLGWCKDGNSKEFLTGTTVVGLENVIFHAAYSNDITVNFRSGADGSYKREETGKVVEIAGGSTLPAKISFPADVESVDGYEFQGWYKEGEKELIKSGIVGEFLTDSEYFAWYEKTVTLTYDTAGGPQMMPVVGTVSVAGGKYQYPTAELKIPVREGFDFKQWVMDGQAVEGTVTLERNQTVTAIWSAHDYTVSFDGNGSTLGEMESFQIKCGEEFTLPANSFQKTYTVALDANGGNLGTKSVLATYIFQGWSTTPSGAVQFLDRESVEDLTKEDGARVVLYAVWKAEEVALPTPTKAGFVFSGWTEANNKIVTPYKTEKNTTLAASWVDAKYAVTVKMGIGADQVVEGKYGALLPQIQGQEQKYKVTFNYSGLKENETVEAAATFQGVFDQPNGRGTKYYEKDFTPCKKWDKETSAATLYGYWIPATVTLPEVQVDGHNIYGWYLNGRKVTNLFTPTRDCELVLGEGISVYGITYNVKGGTLLSNMNSYSYGTMAELPRAWKKGFLFRGWRLPDKTVITSLTGAEMGDLALTAVWERSTKTLENLENKESVYTYAIPEGVETIPDGFFKDCKNLTTVSIPEGVVSIGEEAFSGCESLTAVALPSTVKKVGEGAFAGSALTAATVSGGYFDAAWFFDCAELMMITVTDPNCVFAETELDPMITLYGYSKSTAKDYAEKYSVDFQSIGISFAMTTEFGFGNKETCYVVEGASLTLSKDVVTWLSNKDISFNGYVLDTATSVADKGTELWNKLGNLVWNYGYIFGQDVSVKALWSNGSTNSTKGDKTIAKVSSFVKDKIAYKVHGKKVSVANASKKVVTVPSTVTWEGKTYQVTKIDENAFRGDVKLKKITLGKNVKNVGKNAFRDCKGLKIVKVKASSVKVGKDVLKGTNSVKVNGTAKVKKSFASSR